MFYHNSPKKIGFTLMELLTVIAIIAILATLVMGGVQAVRRRASRAKAEAAIASLEIALGMYYNDLGEYPENDNIVDDCKDLVEALTCKDTKEDWDGPYIRFKQKELDCPASEDSCKKDCNYLDPWGRAYIYEKTADFYLLLSKGEDGIKNTEDDISNK